MRAYLRLTRLLDELTTPLEPPTLKVQLFALGLELPFKCRDRALILLLSACEVVTLLGH